MSSISLTISTIPVAVLGLFLFLPVQHNAAVVLMYQLKTELITALLDVVKARIGCKEGLI